jgi:hypothetical protein
MRLSVEHVDYSYEEVLASLGSYVDQQAGNQIRIVERAASFELEYRVGREPDAVEHVYFEVGKNLELRDAPASSGEYQDLLIALGRELDAVSAQNVAIEDVDQGLVVNYWYEHPTAQYVSQHREFAVGPEERRELLGVQQRRRQLSATR